MPNIMVEVDDDAWQRYQALLPRLRKRNRTFKAWLVHKITLEETRLRVHDKAREGAQHDGS